ncbi:MAG: type II toxin-antitoxin system mRNA interferase toxin, RelE/StbE family [Candidatus Babeliales bacterium]
MVQKNSFEGYAINFTPQAEKELKKLEKKIAKKVDEKLKELVKGTRNLDITRLSGHIETYRLRIGDYRIIFESQKHVITILVIKIAHRREVYRDY